MVQSLTFSSFLLAISRYFELVRLIDLSPALSGDRTREFLLVRQMRSSVNAVSKNICQATRKDYLEKYARMKLSKLLPEHSNNKNSFYGYRAALLFGTAQRASVALRERDNAELGSKNWTDAINELLHCEQIFERYPPDPGRQHCAEGSKSFTWSEVNKGSGFGVPKQISSKSKKHALSPLRRISNWKEKLFDCTSTQYKECLALCALCGVRPSELANGVTVTREVSSTGETLLIVSIIGTKVTALSGQPLRTFRVRTNSGMSKYLLANIDARGGDRIMVSATPSNLTAAVIRAGRKAFPSLSHTVTPYVLRHALASDLKRQSTDFSPVQLAQILGHQVTKTQQHYGYAVCASGASQIACVEASIPVRESHRLPAETVTLRQFGFSWTSPRFGG